MYLPSHFQEVDTHSLHALIRDRGFGLLVVADEDGIDANHVPFVLNTTGDNPLGVLECHLARKNSAWQKIAAGAHALAIIQGPDAYISPSWYPSKAESGMVVPTWNYFAVHVSGLVRVIQEPAWLLDHVARLTDHQEGGRQNPWAVADAPREFTERLVRAIVGIEITIEKLDGKRKASQNQTELNRAGVVAGLNREGTEAAVAMAKLIDELSND